MADSWKGAVIGMPQENTCVNTLDVDEQGRLTHGVVNDTTHLVGNLETAGPGQIWHSAERRW